MAYKNAKIFLLAGMTTLMLLCLLYFASFYTSLNTYNPSEWWIKDLYLYKKYRAEEMIGPKIIIAGGSSVLYGINSKVVEDITGYPVINFGSHALLPLEFHYYKIKEILKPGDIVVLPLEYRRYIDAKDSAWFYNNMLSWGQTDYIDPLNFIEKLRFIAQVPKSRILQGLYNTGKPLPLHSIEQIKAIIKTNNTDQTNAINKNILKWLNEYGELNVDAAPTTGTLQNYARGARLITTKSTARFFTAFEKIRDLVQSKEGTLILSWPVTLRNKALDFSKPEDQMKALRLQRYLKQKGVSIRCNPVLHSLSLPFFFNSILHTNAQGARLNSTNLANCIQQVLTGITTTEIDFTAALQKLMKQEKQFGENLPPLPSAYQN